MLSRRMYICVLQTSQQHTVLLMPRSCAAGVLVFPSKTLSQKIEDIQGCSQDKLSNFDYTEVRRVSYSFDVYCISFISSVPSLATRDPLPCSR